LILKKIINKKMADHGSYFVTTYIATGPTWKKKEKERKQEKREYKDEKRLDDPLSKSMKTEMQTLSDFYLRTEWSEQLNFFLDSNTC